MLFLMIRYLLVNNIEEMINDIRIYNYHDDSPLINRTTQVKEYLDKKLSNVQVNVDFTEVEEKISDVKETMDGKLTEVKETMVADFTEVKDVISDSTNDIKEAIEDAKPCLCNLATKEDVCKAKCAIIKEIDEKFVDLNELVKNN